MSLFDLKMTELADKIKLKNTSVTGKLSVQGMIDAVGNISTGVKLPDGITVTSTDVKEGVFYVDADGVKQEGEMPNNGIVEVTLTDSPQTLTAGYFEKIIIPAKPSSDTGDSTVKFGYWTSDGKFQEVDLSGDSPVDIGEPVTVDAQMFATGKPTPDYPSSGGVSMEFYECASVTNGDTTTWSGYKMEWREGSSSPAVSAIRISGTTNGVADGDYVSDPALTGADRKFINTSNANAFIVWDGDWSLSLNGTNRVACTNTDGSGDLPTGSIEYICSVGFRVMLWGNGVIGSTADAVSAEAVTIGGGGSPSGWYKTDTLAEGLEVKGYYPVVGRIYNADTTIEVKKAFDGVLIPIPQNGLVFYAPLQTDYVDMVSGKHAVTTAGSFTSRAGKDCLRLTNEYIKWDETEGLPIGEGDISLCFLVSPVDDSKRQTYISIGNEDACIPIQYEYASILDFGGNLPADSMMHSVCLTRKGNNNASIYIDGIFVSSRNIPFYPATSFVCLGALTSYGYIQTSNAFFSDVAVYNRELTAAEVLEIHNTLMEDVEQ